MIVTALETVRFVDARVKAWLFRFRVAMVSLPLASNVVLPPKARVPSVAVKVAPETSRVPAPVKARMLEPISKFPLPMVVADGMVMVPLILVISPKLMTGAALRVKLLPSVIICSLAVSMVTVLATVKFEPNVKALSPSSKAVTPKSAVLVNVASAVNDKLVGAVKPLPLVFRSPLRIRVLPPRFKVPLLAVPHMVIFPPLLEISPLARLTLAIRVRSLPLVMIFSLELSIATEFVTVKSVEARFKARLLRSRVAMVTLAPASNVVLPPNKRVPVVAMKDAPDTSKVPAPVRESMLSEMSKVPLEMVVAAGIVMVPLSLVICPKLILGELVKVRLFPTVIIFSFKWSISTALVTAKLEPKVRVLSPSDKAVTLRLAALVNVASAINDRLVGAVNALPFVFKSPFRTRVLPPKSKVPPLAVPLIVILPPVLVS